MASNNFASQLSRLEALPSQQRSDEYQSLLKSAISASSDLSANLVAYVQSITSESVGVIHSRPLLSDFVAQFQQVKDNDVRIEAG